MSRILKKRKQVYFLDKGTKICSKCNTEKLKIRTSALDKGLILNRY